MKKKLLTVLLFFGLTAVSVGTFTSCKDNDEELRVEMAGNRAALEALLKQCQTNCKAEWTRLDGLISDLNSKVEGKLWTESDIKALIAAETNKFALQSALETLEKSLRTLQNQFTPEDVAALHVLIGELGNVQNIKVIYNTLYGEGGTAAAPKEGSLVATVNSLVSDVADIKGDVTDIKGDIVNIKVDVAALEKWFENFTDENGDPMTPAKFQELVKEGAWVAANKVAITEAVNTVAGIKDKVDEIGKLEGAALDSLNKYYEYFPNLLQTQADFDDLYDTLFPTSAGAAPEGGWWSYAEVMERIQANEKAIEKLQSDLDKLFKLLSTRIDEMVTGLVLQATNNPLFGAVNTPFGINSMALVTYYGKSTSSNTVFPSGISGEEQNLGAEAFDAIDWASMMKAGAQTYSLDADVLVNLDENGKANLGTMWFTVNPGTVDNLNVEKFALVNSAEVESDVKLTDVVKDDETVLKFGFSRAAGNGNGLYQAQATVEPADLDNIKINIEPGLTEALKDAVKNHTAADMAHMAKVVYNQLSNVCDAYALRYTYNSVVDTLGTERENKVYSNYGIAATAIKPLGFTTLKGVSLGHVPTVDHITINKDLVDLNLGTFNANGKDFNLNLNFGEPEFDELGNLEVSTEVSLTAEDGQKVTGVVTIDITDKAEEIQKNITDAIQKWLGADGGIDVRVEKSIWYALFNDPTATDSKYPYDPAQPVGVVTDLVNQVNDMTGKIQDKLDELVNKINNDYLGKVNRLVDRYNRVANRINNVLKNPNHYLQSAIIYKTSSDLGVLSTNAKQPTQFKGNGEAIELFITTYNFEVVAPVFKKFIGVTKVTKNGVEMPELAKAANESANFGEVLNGDVNRVALNVKGATNGTYLYEVAYQAVDYMGYTSTVKAYIQVVR